MESQSKYAETIVSGANSDIIIGSMLGLLSRVGMEGRFFEHDGGETDRDLIEDEFKDRLRQIAMDNRKAIRDLVIRLSARNLKNLACDLDMATIKLGIYDDRQDSHIDQHALLARGEAEASIYTLLRNTDSNNPLVSLFLNRGARRGRISSVLGPMPYAKFEGDSLTKESVRILSRDSGPVWMNANPLGIVTRINTTQSSDCIFPYRTFPLDTTSADVGWKPGTSMFKREYFQASNS